MLKDTQIGKEEFDALKALLNSTKRGYAGYSDSIKYAYYDKDKKNLVAMNKYAGLVIYAPYEELETSKYWQIEGRGLVPASCNAAYVSNYHSYEIDDCKNLCKLIQPGKPYKQFANIGVANLMRASAASGLMLDPALAPYVNIHFDTFCWQHDYKPIRFDGYGVTAYVMPYIYYKGFEFVKKETD